MSIFIEYPVLTIIVIGVVGFAAYMGKLIFDEFSFNKALQLKQKSMRVSKANTLFKGRIARLATATAVPVIAVSMMFVAIGLESNNINYKGELPNLKTNITTVNSADDIMQIIQDFNTNFSAQHNIFVNREFVVVDDVAVEFDDLEFGAPESPGDQITNDVDGSGSDDYSETNNQVEGVDEMDNVLTDGKFVYIMNYDKVQIILAYTVEGSYDVLNVYKEFNFDQFQDEGTEFYPIGMYVDGDNFIVIGNSYETTCVDYYYEDYETEPATDEGSVDEPTIYCYNQHKSRTKVFVFDKEDDFTLQDTYVFKGGFVGTRKIDNSLYFITSEYINYYLLNPEDTTYDYEVTIEDYLPEYTVNGQTITVDYEDVMYVDGANPTSFTTFYGINLDTTKTTMKVVLGDAGYSLYVSNNNMYLAGTVFSYDEVLAAKYEDDQYSDEQLESPYSYYTSILKMEISDGEVEFKGAGAVDGQNLDQFSMDEHNGFLRIVTTSNMWFWRSQSERTVINRLSILDENMEVISVIDEGIGEPGESVFATRFAGDYGYVVTFLQTDPFYVFDLSDPYNPTILSELKIPGFSDYLQPLSDDFVLGIGYGDQEGGTQGLRVSLYDVSNKKEPAVLADTWTYEYDIHGYMWTSTVYNHKDLLVDVAKGIIAMPYTRNGFDETNRTWTYASGILVLNIDLEQGSLSDFGDEYMVEHSESNYYDTYVYKSKYISDYFYTVSSKYIKVSTIENPETILKSLQIGEGYNYEMPEEVEPEVVVEATCTDGYVLVDGNCILDTSDSNSETSLDQFVHIEHWAELTALAEPIYLVYVYSAECQQCIDLQDIMYEFGMEQRIPTFFINSDIIEGEPTTEYFNEPVMYFIEDENIILETSGAENIIDLIMSIE